jgi:hypothetical protein
MVAGIRIELIKFRIDPVFRDYSPSTAKLQKLLSWKQPVNGEVLITISFFDPRAAQWQVFPVQDDVVYTFASQGSQNIAILCFVEAVCQLHAPVPFEHIAIFIWDRLEIDINRGAGEKAEILHLDRRQESIIL